MAAKKKKALGEIKLEIPAGQAMPGPPVGPALGQHRLNIVEFCKRFNDASKNLEPGVPCRTVISYYAGNKFDFEIRKPPVSYFLKRAAGLPKGGPTPGRKPAGSVTLQQVREIAETKQTELNANDVEAAMRIVAGSARSMGFEVQG